MKKVITKALILSCISLGALNLANADFKGPQAQNIENQNQGLTTVQKVLSTAFHGQHVFLQGNIIQKVSHDKYMFKFGNNILYQRPLLITNRKKWHFTGVLHEYLDADERRTSADIVGNYYIVSGRTGARSQNPNKYRDDAIILKHAFEIEPRADLKTRYAFYCAQSFSDAKMVDDAIEWYEKCLTLNGWNQEKYCSCIKLGELYKNKKDNKYHDKYIYYWSKSCEYDPERIDGIVNLATAFYEEKNHVMVNAIYHKWKNHKQPSNKLFLKKYNYDLEYLNSISAYYAKDFESGI